jgi:branched-subunit amino acid aminotransferase/4-amino-4-deoxychorismate lyase
VNAKAKDSEWVRQRKAWEATKPADVNELLLASPGSSALLEGLTSNFFALDAEGAVVTAEAGVLGGTVRELVLQVRGI